MTTPPHRKRQSDDEGSARKRLRFTMMEPISPDEATKALISVSSWQNHISTGRCPTTFKMESQAYLLPKNETSFIPKGEYGTNNVWYSALVAEYPHFNIPDSDGGPAELPFIAIDGCVVSMSENGNPNYGEKFLYIGIPMKAYHKLRAKLCETLGKDVELLPSGRHTSPDRLWFSCGYENGKMCQIYTVTITTAGPGLESPSTTLSIDTTSEQNTLATTPTGYCKHFPGDYYATIFFKSGISCRVPDSVEPIGDERKWKLSLKISTIRIFGPASEQRISSSVSLPLPVTVDPNTIL